MEADEVAWKGLKGIGKGLKGGAQGALKVAEKTSMAVLETKDKIEDLEKIGAKGPKKHKVHLDSDARAEMKARAAAANTKPEIEDLGPDQSGMSLLGGLAEKAKATTVAVAAKTQETAQMATSKTMEAGETLKKAAGVDDASAARERAAGGGQEIKFDEDGNPIIPEAPSKGVVGGLVGGVVGTTTGLVGGVVGTTLEVGHMTGEGLKKAVGVDDKDAARQRAAGGGQEIKFDADGNPIMPDAASSGISGRSLVGGLAGNVGGLAGKAMAKADAAAAKAKSLVPTSEEGVPPGEAAAPEPEVEPEQAKAIVRNTKWAKKE